MPTRMSHAPKAGTAHAVGRAGSRLIPPAPQEGLGGVSVGQDVSLAAWGRVRPVVPSCGSLQIRMASGSRAPQHRTPQPGGGSAARGCVGRCKEDVREQPQGSAPHQHPGCWGGDARVWVPSRVPRGLVPPSAPACCAGPKGQDHDLEAGFLLGDPMVGTAPVTGTRAPS